jgi:hypothetical protein
MALSTIAVPPDAKRDARARALATQVAVWPLFTLNQPHGSFPIGSQFRQATGSHGEKYLVNAVVCECVDYTSGHICKHIRAVVLWEARQQPVAQPAPAPKARPSYDQLYPACAGGCGDLVEKNGQRCYACASDETRRLDQIAKRETVAA